MAHVVDEKLALDEEIKRLEGYHIFNFRHRSLKGSLVHGQEAIPLHADPHGVAVLHFLRLHRHHAADGGFHQTDSCIKKLLFLLGELLLEHPFEDFVCVV